MLGSLAASPGRSSIPSSRRSSSSPSILLGAFAVVMLPREEEPQIKVPMVDVMVAMPGFSAEESRTRYASQWKRLW